MKISRALTSALLLVSAAAVSAQSPVTLEHSIPPPVTVQSGSELGYSVATDGAYTVCGAPSEDARNPEIGVVKVFDSATGALLHVLRNPDSGYFNFRFGSSLAISGTRVVVGNSEARGPGAFEQSGKAYIFDLAGPDPTVPLHTLDNPSPATDDFFGNSVAISGSRVVIGARQDDEGAVNAGRAYVYDLDSGTPAAPVETLNNPDPAADDFFGWSVAISGNRVVVGAYLDDFGAADAGRVYVYDLDLVPGTPAIPAFNLNNPAPQAGDWFGISVAVEGEKVVVGALLDDTSGIDSGIAYLFHLAGGVPTVPVAELANPSPSASDLFGYSVAISGDLVALGAYQDDAGETNAGSTCVYNINQLAAPVLVHTVNNPTPAVQDFFGVAVALSGSRLAVGAYLDDTGATDAGSAYLYELGGATPEAPSVTLNQPGPIPLGAFGYAVAISGNRMVAGAPTDRAGTYQSGSACVFNLDSPTPTVPILVLNNPSPAVGDFFGFSVAISGNLVVVGAPFDTTGAAEAGIAYVYDLGSLTPEIPVFVLNNPDPAGQGRFGTSVALDGNQVAVGAPYKTSGGVFDVGCAYVFDLSIGAVPPPPAYTVLNPAQSSSLFGYSVSLAGNRLVVGAPYENTGAPTSGGAYVFELGGQPFPLPSHHLSNPTPANFEIFGNSVAISGSRILVGATNGDSGALRAGNAYLYDVLSPDPVAPVLTFYNPSPAADDRFGSSVAISGGLAVIGASNDDTGAVDAGSAYVFDLASAAPGIPMATLSNPQPAIEEYFGTSVAIDGTRIAIGNPEDSSIAYKRGFAYIFGAGETDFQIDATIPACLVGPSATISGSIASGAVVIGSIRYSIDNGPPVTLGSPGTASPSFSIDLSALDDGEHTIVITATAAGGTERFITATFHRDRVGLSIAKGVVMTWACGVLQTSTNGEDWTDVPGATSPFAVPDGGPPVLWQVRSP